MAALFFLSASCWLEGSETPRCPEPRPNEKYCVDASYQCYNIHESFCANGQWSCESWATHPPAPPEFEDWAWRCEVYSCYAQGIPRWPIDPWPEAAPYTPPDPASLTGEWALIADSDDIIAPGCEKQPRQYARGVTLAVDPTNPDVMYTGFYTEKWAAKRWVTGVFKSIDGGRTWFEARANLGIHGVPMPDVPGPSVRRLFIVPNDPQRLFASVEYYGLYQTRDGARTWEFVDVWPGYYLEVGPAGKGPNGTFYVSSGGALFASTDDGVTWSQRSLLPVYYLRWIWSFYFDRRYPDRIWAGTMPGPDSPPTEGYIYLSDDAGYTWIELGRGLASSGISAMDACGFDPDQMAAAGGSLYLSSDGGMTWRRAPTTVEGKGTVSFVKYAPLPDRCRLYASDAGWHSLQWTEDGGATWHMETKQWLDDVFFNPFVPEMMVGISVDGNRAFELWAKE
ncbi:MAG: exo-alpha-sialidase [Myxococcales bacterium]|nr:exo-alpha-sialidase [Myxococcales bacterium]